MPIETLGMLAANTAAGLFMGGINDRRQIKQQGKLQAMQEAGNIRMAEHSQKLQKDMWDYTNYENQMKHLEAAGLNPALLYGMKGGGGVTVGGGGSGTQGVSGGHAPSGGGEVMGMGMMMNQMQLLKAQKENLEAQTDKTKAEADKTRGVDTEKGKTEILDLLQGIENKKEAEVLTRVQQRLANIQANLQTATYEDAIRLMGWNSEKAMQEVEGLRYETNIKENTWTTKVKMVQAELIELYATIGLKQTMTGKVAAETVTEKMRPREIATKLQQGWDALQIQMRNATANEKRQAEDAWRNDVSEQTKLPLEIIDEITDVLKRSPRDKRTHTVGERDGKYYEEYKNERY